MTPTNQKTLGTYETHWRAYIDNTPHEVSGDVKRWIDGLLSDMPQNAKILELGSGFGRDAAYMEAQGYRVERTDAVLAFVEHMTKAGHNARLFNPLKDTESGPYDLIFANAVFVHFTREETTALLPKLAHALTPKGKIALSLKRGEGEAWSKEKLGAERYFCYWTEASLEALLKAQNLGPWVLDHDTTNKWLYLTLHKTPAQHS